MIGCLVHYGRSYQRVAERVSASLSGELHKISKNSFCAIARAIPSAKNKSDVFKLFNALKGDVSLITIKSIIPHLSEDALLDENTLKVAWRKAQHWSEWWMRLPHLKMLSKVFAVNSDWSGAPRDTNGVERVNQDSKSGSASCLLKAMENLYKKDKMIALSYMAADKNVSLHYRNKSDEARRQAAASRKRQRLQSDCSDRKALFGPPDKRVNFSKYHDTAERYKIGQRVEVRYDDDVWYKGTLIEFNKSTNEWVAQFDVDGEKTSIQFPDEDIRVL